MDDMGDLACVCMKPKHMQQNQYNQQEHEGIKNWIVPRDAVACSQSCS